MLLYNGDFIPEAELRLPLTNRAFQFNDGFFETIIVANGKLRFWSDHQLRMEAAAKALKMELPRTIVSGEMTDKLLQLAEQNKATTYGRLKLRFWRSGGGLYTPENNTTDWMATISPVTSAPTSPLHIGICDSVHTNYSPFSFFKGPNALLYVMAGVEKKEKGLDDMLLLNRQKQVSELTSSNIFWMKNRELYTPALDTGCVNGIARSNILRWCQKSGIKIREVYFSSDALLQADTVFSANVTGVRSVARIGENEVATDDIFLAEVRQALGF